MVDLPDNTNTGTQWEKGVKYKSFPARMGDLTAMDKFPIMKTE